MKSKLILCLACVMGYGVLAYIFMWPPVVREYSFHHHPTSPANPCINNLRQIDAAVHQWALENNKHAGEPVTLEQLKPYIKLDSQGELPTCPYGGKYAVTVVGTAPTCSFGLYPPDKRVRVGYFYWEYGNPQGHILP